MFYVDFGCLKNKTLQKVYSIIFPLQKLLAEGTLVAWDRGCSRRKSAPRVAISISKNSPQEEETGRLTNISAIYQKEH